MVIGKGCWLKKGPDIRKRRIELDDKEKEGLENSLDKKEEVEEETAMRKSVICAAGRRARQGQ